LGHVELVDLLLVVGCVAPVLFTGVALGVRARSRRASATPSAELTIDLDTLTRRTVVAAAKVEEPREAPMVSAPPSRTRELLDVYYGSARRAAAGTPSPR
jgi:hypothetical protein